MMMLDGRPSKLLDGPSAALAHPHSFVELRMCKGKSHDTNTYKALSCFAFLFFCLKGD